MDAKAILLFSGGLDSILACKIIAAQGIEVSGLTFETPFFGAARAKATALQLGIPHTVVNITEEHLEMLHAPRYGYGKNMNPCIDCRVLMLKIAKRLMEETGADFLFTGEVVGQRPMSQGKQTLLMTAKNAGLADRLLRPLSARLLPETEPERAGKVDRSRLLDLQGRGRKRQIEMAGYFGISSWPSPAGGCLLTDPIFSRRLRDLFAHHPDYRIRDIELLKTGRHLRLNDEIKVIVGRNAGENDLIENMADPEDALIRVNDSPGPTVLVPAGGDEAARALACRICLRYSDAPRDREVSVTCLQNGNSSSFTTISLAPEDSQSMTI
ncbi:MAG: asparagine synthase-related protein [Syntrophales bacterium]